MDDTALPREARIGGLDRRELLELLRVRGVRLNPAAEALFGDPRFETLGSESVVPIVARSVADLGFPDGATYSELCRGACEIGLVEAPLELGPYLRLQYLDQPEGSVGFPETQHRAPPGSITIASAPLDENDETPKGFYLRRIDGELWLRGYRSDAEHVWSPEDVFVFVRGSLAPTSAR